ncbi:cache domain-containing protein [Thiotrichales bacterium 19X7-9]|nr:cache domain-containing protein [Thiotrichales bacterium 19X7-9]
MQKLIITTLILILSTVSYAGTLTTETPSNKLFVSMLANKINSQLETLSYAVTALGKTYAVLYKKNNRLSHNSQKIIVKSSVQNKGIRELFLFDQSHQGLTYRAPVISSYILNDQPLTKTQWYEINALIEITPTMITLYNIFNDGWVYITTEDNIMIIYPYVPLEQAVNNKNPTETTFYEAANFKDKKAGWSEPYVDLVGDGLMVTTSYPIYKNNQLLGVASIDITIDKLLKSLALLPLNQLGSFTLFTASGKLITNLSKSQKNPNDQLTAKLFNKINAQTNQVSQNQICYQNINYQIYATKIKANNWVLINTVKTNDQCKS